MLCSDLADTTQAHPATEARPNGPRTVIETRFGQVEIDAANIITLARPIHGFSELMRFALLPIPAAETWAFKLFQAVDEPGVGFIVLPMSRKAGMIAEQDMAEACRALGVEADAAVVLLLVTLRKALDGSTLMTANLRAPLILDVEARRARQHIFTGGEYPVCLTLEPGN